MAPVILTMVRHGESKDNLTGELTFLVLVPLPQPLEPALTVEVERLLVETHPLIEPLVDSTLGRTP